MGGTDSAARCRRPPGSCIRCVRRQRPRKGFGKSVMLLIVRSYASDSAVVARAIRRLDLRWGPPMAEFRW